MKSCLLDLMQSLTWKQFLRRMTFNAKFLQEQIE